MGQLKTTQEYSTYETKMKFRMGQKDRISRVRELQQDKRIKWEDMTAKDRKNWLRKMSTTSDVWHLDCYKDYLRLKQVNNHGIDDRRYKAYDKLGSSFSSTENMNSYSTASRRSSNMNQQNFVNLTKVHKVSYQTLNRSGAGHLELDVEEEDDLMMLLDGIA